jgi:hypothetical protein
LILYKLATVGPPLEIPQKYSGTQSLNNRISRNESSFRDAMMESIVASNKAKYEATVKYVYSKLIQ